MRTGEAISSKLLALGIAGVLLLSAVDYVRLLGYEWGPGWDFKCNCDAAYTFFNGGNPYRSLDYSFIRNAFTYLPFWLPIHGWLCKALSITDIKTTIIYYPVYVSAFLLVLWFVAKNSFSSHFDRLLFAAIVMCGLNGFLWIIRTGNIALLEVIFLMCAAMALHRYCETRTASWRRFFAVLFGCFMAVKTATLAFALLSLFAPGTKQQRFEVAAIALGIGLLPLAISYAFLSPLMPQYFLMLANKIEGNVNPHICSPSLYCFFRDIVLVPSKLPWAANVVRALSLGVPAMLLSIAVVYTLGPKNRKALLSLALDRRGHRAGFSFNGSSFDALMLGFVYIQLLMPRLKEYTFALISVSFAYLIVRLPGTSKEKALLTLCLAAPIINFAELVNSEDSKHFSYYLQLFAAGSVFFYLLVRYCTRPQDEQRAPIDRSSDPDSSFAQAPAEPLRLATYLPIVLSLLIAALFWTISEPFHNGTDAFRLLYPANDFFRAYYPAGAAVWQDPARFRNLIISYDFVNLPIVAFLFVPFGLMEEHVAASAYMGIGIAGALFTIVLLARLTDDPRRSVLKVLCLFLASGPLLYSFKEGNSTHLLLLMLVGGFTLVQQLRTEHLAGAILGLAGVIKPPLLLVVVYFALRQRWRVVVSGVSIVLASILLSISVFGAELNLLWLKTCVLPFVGRPVHAFNVQSIDGLLIRWHLGSDFIHGWGPNDLPSTYTAVRWFLIGTLIAISAAAMRQRTCACEIPDGAVVVTLAVIISPVSWTHYYAFLLLPWALYFRGRLRSDALTHYLMIGGVILASLPAAHVPLHGPSRQTLWWQLLSSAWLVGGLLTLAALLRSRRLTLAGATDSLAPAFSLPGRASTLQ